MANAKYMGKLKGKMPPPPSKADEADPMLEIPEDEESEDGGDVSNGSAGGDGDDGADARTIGRGKDGMLSEEGEAEEHGAEEGDMGPGGHEDREGPHEKSAEEHLAACSDEELEDELERRKAEAAKGGRGGTGADHGAEAKPADDEAEEYS